MLCLSNGNASDKESNMELHPRFWMHGGLGAYLAKPSVSSSEVDHQAPSSL